MPVATGTLMDENQALPVGSVREPTLPSAPHEPYYHTNDRIYLIAR